MEALVSEAYLVAAGTDRRFPLVAGQTWAVGRGDGCAVLLDSRSVSRLHALIQRRSSGEYFLVDLGSRNGSFVNGRRVSVPMGLKDQDRLLFAEEELTFCNPLGAVEPGSPAGSTRNTPTAALNAQSLTTIVVVDIRDFTPMARKLSEAVLSQTIGTWFLRVGQVAEQRGSWAQQYIGDAMMAVWVHDDASTIPADLARALRAVCEIERTTTEVSRSLPLPTPLRIGAGISTGPAILGGTDYTALGDTVNAAFRLEAVTKNIGLGVALGEGTFRALEVPDESSPFQCRRVQLKGYEGSSVAWAISFEELHAFLASRGQ